MMVNEAIRIGLDHDVTNMKRLSSLSYSQLSGYNCLSYYKKCAISRAGGILAARKKSITRGYPTKSPYAVKPHLVSCYGFKLANGIFELPLGRREYFEIPLNGHTREVLSEPGLTVRSFTLTASTVSLTISKKVSLIECVMTAGPDRNLRELTCGNGARVVKYNLSKAVRIADTTTEIISSFKRNDARIRKKIASKYGRRRKDRVGHLLNCVTKDIVRSAYESREAIVLEDIRGIRSLYRRGNGQGRRHRGRMNSWAFFEAQRQVEYKAAWKGVPVIHLTKAETRGTTTDCARCGERLQSPARDDPKHRRQLWCRRCKSWIDRDVNAVANQAARGRLRFDRSLSGRTKGDAGEAMKGNAEHDGEPLILRVDASKLIRWRKPRVIRTSWGL
ncbi:MAG: transposase [Thaumarchaeota archaeon]|nr:transposase [Nitrososphaerota archaeon]